MPSSKTMEYGRISDIYLVVHGLEDPTSNEWTDYVRDMESCADSLIGVLVYTAGGGPNASQRKHVAEMWQRRGKMPSIAVVTPSRVVRSIVTAINWFVSQPLRTFAPSELSAAMQYLNVAPALRTDLLQRIERFAPSARAAAAANP